MNRSANETILGYFYQFDKSILQLLECKNGSDKIIVEGIEDIDLATASEKTAIQCKYYSKTNYNHSVIAKPIRLMLSHYKDVISNGKEKVFYKIYGHYKAGQEKLTIPIDLESLKSNFLIYKKDKIQHKHHEDLHLNNTELLEFLDLLTIDINASSYEDQFGLIIQLIQNEFKCESFEAEYFYYNNALKVIKDLAVKENLKNRSITKSLFLSQINKKRILFNIWFLEHKGRQYYYRQLRKKYFTNLNSSPFERFFLIEVPKNFIQSDLKNIVFLLSKKWTKISKRTTEPFCPYLYFHNLPDSKLLELKNELANENYKFSDGYNYMGASFSASTIIEEASFNNQIQIKFINELEHIKLIFEKNKKTKEIFQFYLSKSFYDNINSESMHIKIQLNNLSDIEEII